MQRLKLWKVFYTCNNRSDNLNWGASTFSLFTPFFGIIIRLDDAMPHNLALRTSIELAWQFNFKNNKEGDLYYHKFKDWIFKEESLRDVYLRNRYAN